MSSESSIQRTFEPRPITRTISEGDLSQLTGARAPLTRRNSVGDISELKPRDLQSEKSGDLPATPDSKGHKVSKLVKIGVPVVGALAIAAIVTLGILASQGLLGVAAQSFMSNSVTWIQATAAKGLTGAKALAAKVSTWARNNTGSAIGIGAGAVTSVVLLAIGALGLHKALKHKKQKTAPDVAKETVLKEGKPNIFRRIWTNLSSISCPRIPNPFRKAGEKGTTETANVKDGVLPESSTPPAEVDPQLEAMLANYNTQTVF